MSTSTQPAPSGSMGPDVSSDDALSERNVKKVVASSGLPDAAKIIILRIVKRTRLSRGEKVGVAIELIAHFGDGIDAGTSIEDMLTGFGNETTFVKLTRRAKMRCRSWPRRAMRRAGQALACFIVFYIGAIFYYASGSPTISVDYVAMWNEPVLATPEEDRAWPVYRQALLSLDRKQIVTVAERGSVFPGDPTWNDAARLVQASQPALEKVRLAAAKPHLGYVYSVKIHEGDRGLFPKEYERARNEESTNELDVPIISVNLPYLNELRHLGHLLAWDALLAADQRKGDRVVKDIEAMIGMAGQVRRPGNNRSLIDQLVGIVIAQRALGTLGEILRRHPNAFTDEHLQRLAHRLVADDVAPAISLEGERISFRDILQHLYTDDGNGDGHLLPKAHVLLDFIRSDWTAEPTGVDTSAYLLAPLTGGGTASRKQVSTKYEELMQGTQARLAQPYWETRLTDDPVHTWVVSSPLPATLRYPVLMTLIPALGKTHVFQQELVGRRDGVLTALALQAYRRKHSRWPQSLDQLVPSILPSMPRDRITGDPLRYRLVNDQPVVYSVGQDVDDDGGVPAAIEPVKFHEIPEGASAEMIKKVNDANERLGNETPRQRWERTNVLTGPNGPHSKHAKDGDWILWRAANWSAEPNASTSNDTE